MVWHYENTCASKRAPEVVWDYLTVCTVNDHNTPAFKAENKGKDRPREVERLPGNNVHPRKPPRAFGPTSSSTYRTDRTESRRKERPAWARGRG